MEELRLSKDGDEKHDVNSLDSQQPIDVTEYPTKFRLTMTVVALMLSMFLVSETHCISSSRRSDANNQYL
jgi:hypothetical protein